MEHARKNEPLQEGSKSTALMMGIDKNENRPMPVLSSLSVQSVESLYNCDEIQDIRDCMSRFEAQKVEIAELSRRRFY